MQPKHRKIRLLAHNVRSLWNVGSFFRTADAFAVEKIYLTGYTGHPPRKEITKTAIGAEEFVHWEHHTDPIPVIEELQRNGWKIVALEITPDAIPLDRFPLPNTNILLIVGHELTGVPPEILSHCNTVVKIPMLGKKESLNVAVVVGIAIHSLTSYSRYEHAHRPHTSTTGFSCKTLRVCKGCMQTRGSPMPEMRTTSLLPHGTPVLRKGAGNDGRSRSMHRLVHE